jgi:hypothetical protein
VADPHLLDRAADCYLRAGQPAEAARCYRDAGAHRQAADIYARLGRHRDAATDYARCGAVELAAWTLVHHVGDPGAARAVLAQSPAVAVAEAPPEPGASPPTRLPAAPHSRSHLHRGGRSPRPPATARRRLVLARCDIAEGAPGASVLPVLAGVAAELARPNAPSDVLVEGWAVALAEAVRRYDQISLVYAAAVRGGRHGAAERWARWSQAMLHSELTLPTAPASSRHPAVRRHRAGDEKE